MTELAKILCVDDEPNVLAGLSRILFDDYEVDTATSGKEALAALETNEYAVIISDMRMPEMNGAQFLALAKQRAPDTVRMLLTGQSDIESAISAINDGNIFRFLIKPCPEEKLTGHINDAIRMYRMVQMEKELLNKTLMGTVNTLTEILSIVAPSAFSRSNHIKDLVSHMSHASQQEDIWQYEIAALLSQIGCIVLPPEILEKAFSTQPLDPTEKQMIASTPLSGSKLISGIPRLENVAEIIKYQNSNTSDNLDGLPATIAIGVRMLRVAIYVDKLAARENISVSKAVNSIRAMLSHQADIALLDSLSNFREHGGTQVVRALNIRELIAGMILNADVTTTSGSLVLRKGQKLNSPLIERLSNFARGVGVTEPVSVITTS